MPKNSEVVFEMLAASGDIIIERIHTNNGDRFIYHHDETDITGEGLDITEEKEYNDFETPFRLIRSKYPWFTFWVNAIHDDYREYILRELLEDLDRNHVTLDEFEFSLKRFEEMLKVKLEYGQLPLTTDLQDIIIKFYNGTKTEYDYQRYSSDYCSGDARSDDLKVYQKEESICWKEIKCTGTIDFSGSSVIIKNEFKQPLYVFSSEKAFVSATPVFSDSKGWYYARRS